MKTTNHFCLQRSEILVGDWDKGITINSIRLRCLARPHFKKRNKIIRSSISEFLVGKTGNINTEMSVCPQRLL